MKSTGLRLILGTGAGNRAPETEVARAIPLARALLCLDCESIFEATGPQRCPACGSTIAWAIAKSLNRDTTNHDHDHDNGETT